MHCTVRSVSFSAGRPADRSKRVCLTKSTQAEEDVHTDLTGFAFAVQADNVTSQHLVQSTAAAHAVNHAIPGDDDDLRPSFLR